MSKTVAFPGRHPHAATIRGVGRGVRIDPLKMVELAAVALAVVLALAPVRPQSVEAWYSTAAYPRIERALTPLSNRLPFALLDLLLVVLAAAAIVSVGTAVRVTWRTRTFGRLGRTLGHVAAGAAVIYALFLLLWGFNYRRVQMSDRLVVDRDRPTPEQVVDLALMAVAQMNTLYAAAHPDAAPVPEWQDAALRSAFADVQRALSDAPDVEPGRLKHSLLGPYFRWTGVDGMVNPFGLEVIANPDLLPFERPFVAAHEWGHLAGYANEAEANFVGWLTCVRASPRHQYSGWFYLYWQISGEVNARERTNVNASLAEGPRRDVNAVIARLRRGEIPALQRASWQVYDKYLKANRVESGLRSYGEVVTLLLRARFEPGWTPVRRVAFPSPASPVR
jgi:hypothetical protein